MLFTSAALEMAGLLERGGLIANVIITVYVHTQIRSQRDSEPVPYLYLPDEILLQIFSYLPHKDLVSCARVCSQFYRISMDETLCKCSCVL